jgi:hypothetical protein
MGHNIVAGNQADEIKISIADQYLDILKLRTSRKALYKTTTSLLPSCGFQTKIYE